jgi:hypothetical protein
MKHKIIEEIYLNKNLDDYYQYINPINNEELKQEVIMQLYNMNDNLFNDYVDKKILIYVVMTIAKRISYGTVKNSGIFSAVKMTELNFDIEDLSIVDNTESMLNKIKNGVDNLHWYDKTIFKLYYEDGMKLKDISEATGINIKSIHYSISKSRKKIKKEI